MKAKFPVLLKNSVTYGLILGVIFIIVSLLIYILDFNVFGIFYSVAYFLLIGLGLPVTFCILGTNNLRVKHQENKVITYLDAAVHCAILILTGMVLSNLYSYVFNHFIDKEYLKHMVDRFVEMMNSYNVPQEKIDDSVAKMEKGFGFPRQLITSVVTSVVLALIVSIFIRRKEKIAESY